MIDADNFATATVHDSITLTITFSGQAGSGFLSSSISESDMHALVGSVTLNGVRQPFAFFPPPTPISFASPLTFVVALDGSVSGDSSGNDYASNYLAADFRFFEADGTTPAAITVSVAPEPSTWAMLLAGVALLGGRAVRRLPQRRPRL
jgi:hypothetical protein